MSNPIQIDKVVAQAMESKGINQAIGVYGEHKIRLGKESPLRLDKIKANDIPFAGFSTATKIVRGQQGVRNCVADTLKFLCRPNGKLDARHLLGAIKAGSMHMDRLERLHQLPLQAQDAPHMWMFADAVKNLSNNDLAAIYQTFVTPHMDLIQTALQREGQINPQAEDARYAAEQLFDLQALVLKEVSDRVAVDRNMPGADALPSLGERLGKDGPLTMPTTPVPERQDMSPANVLTLVETAAQSSTTRERTSHAVKEEFEAREMPRMSARVIGNVLRSAELTINMQVEGLLSPNSLLRQPNEPKVNIFHLAKDGHKLKGEEYIKLRDVTEKNMFPELAARPTDNAPGRPLLDSINADERPTYGALNLAHQSAGAVSSHEYGSFVVVLKPQVAQRATYTVDDSFFNQPLNFSEERKDTFYRLLDSLVGVKVPVIDLETQETSMKDVLTTEQAEKLRDPASPAGKLLKDFFDDNAGTQPLSDVLTSELYKLGFTEEPRADAMTSFMLNVFGDPALSRSRTATYDNLEALVPHMRTDTSNSLAFMAQQLTKGEPTCSLSGARYIEAQIQGPLIPSRDIAEIRYDPEMLDNMPEADRDALIGLLNSFHSSTGVPVNALVADTVNAQIEDLDDTTNKFDKFHVQHWNKATLSEVAQRYEDNILDYLQKDMRQYPQLAALLPAGELPVRGRALDSLRVAFHREFEILTKVGVDVASTEEGMAADALSRASANVLKDKQNLVVAMEQLPFESPKQKAAFRNWVLSAAALKNPAEMVFIHTQARAFAGQLMQMLDAQPAPDAATLFRTMSQAHDAVANALPELAASLKESFAPDEKSTEFTRVAFMAHSLIQHADANGNARLLRLRQMMDSAEIRGVMGQLETLKGMMGGGGPKDSSSLLGGLSYLQQNLYELQSSTGQRWEEPQKFLGTPAMMSPEMWGIMDSLSPDTAASLRALYPPYEAFPAPANPAQLPSSDTQRRDFLIRHLDAYINHEKTFEVGTSTHGRGHITRAYIYATAMCTMLEAQGLHPDRNAVLCGIAGHDIGRMRGGDDRWEGRSAAMTIKAMREDFGGAPADNNNSPERLAQVLNAEHCEAQEDPHSLGTAYETQLARCIDSHRGKTLESMLLNSADSLDIGRVGEFDLDKLEFLRESVNDEKAEEIREQLVKEANILQRMTNPLCSVRNSLEVLQRQQLAIDNEDILEQTQNQINNVYGDVRHAFAQEWTQSSADFVSSFESVLHRAKDQLPLLYRYYFRGNAAGENAA